MHQNPLNNTETQTQIVQFSLAIRSSVEFMGTLVVRTWSRCPDWNFRRLMSVEQELPSFLGEGGGGLSRKTSKSEGKRRILATDNAAFR